MNELRSAARTDDAILGEFAQAHHEADDKEAVLARFTTAHPHLAEEFRELVAMQQMLLREEPAEAAPAPRQLPDFRILRPIA